MLTAILHKLIPSNAARREAAQQVADAARNVLVEDIEAAGWLLYGTAQVEDDRLTVEQLRAMTGPTGYIDRIAGLPKDFGNVSCGRDEHGRKVVVLRYKMNGRPMISAFFQRYGDSNATWVAGDLSGYHRFNGALNVATLKTITALVRGESGTYWTGNETLQLEPAETVVQRRREPELV